MIYDKDEIYKQALAATGEDSIYLVKDVISLLPCGKTTFYYMFPDDSEELNSIKKRLNRNKVIAKQKLRKRWSSDDASPVLQLALYKIIADKEEIDALSMKREEEIKQVPIVWVETKTYESDNKTNPDT